MSVNTDQPGGKQTLGLFNSDRRWSAGAPPRDVTSWVITALVAAAVIILLTWRTLWAIYVANVRIDAVGWLFKGWVAPGSNTWLDAVFVIVLGLLVLLLLKPASTALRQWQAAKQALATNDLIAARSATASSLNSAHLTLGYGAMIVVLLALAQFLMANDLAVSRTFLNIPVMLDSCWLVLKAFWINIYVAVIAEILVLIVGLLIAVARLLPGEAGHPVRLLAIIYTDMFRGMPAIINIYLVGFGFPLTGLPILKDLAPETYAIIALTLTYSAYVAEVYRAGIEGIHRSQVAAARSLGLSYVQTLRYVVVPQAVRRIIPPLLNDFIGLQKDTALINVIGSIDAFNQARIYAANHFNLSPVTVVAFLFFIVTIPQARFVDHLLERDQRRMRA